MAKADTVSSVAAQMTVARSRKSAPLTNPHSDRRVSAFQSPTPVEIRFIASGEDHASAIDYNGNCWLWGRNTHGQCGLSPEHYASVSTPHLLLFQDNSRHKVVQIACGGDHTLVLNHDNEVFSFGLNDSGQLGLSSSEYDSFHIPKKVVLFQEKVVTWLSAGSNHSGALTVEGYVFVWGSNARGQLGLADAIPTKPGSNLSLPKIMEPALGRGICKLAMSFSQTFLGNSEPGFYADPESEVF